MTEQQLHHEVRQFESYLDNVYPIDLEARDYEIEHLREIERELRGGE